MSDLSYTTKEILDIQFKGFAKDFDEIKELLRKQDVNSEKQFVRLDNEISALKKEVNELKQDNARYKLLIGIGATIGATLISYIVNRIF